MDRSCPDHRKLALSAGSGRGRPEAMRRRGRRRGYIRSDVAKWKDLLSKINIE